MSKCPSCGSRNTKKKHMVWASGTRTSQSRSTGIGLSSRGTFGIGVGRGSSRSQSNLAAACAPPKSSISPKLIVGFLGVLFIPPLLSGILSLFTEPNLLHGIMNFLVCASLLGLLIFGLSKLYQKMDQKNKQALGNYGNTWVCIKCGTTFL